MLKCAQAHREHYPVASSSSSRKIYPVKMFRSNELPSCICTGFMTKRNKNANIIGGGFAGAGAGLARSTAAWCKHLEEVKNTTCDWEQKPGESYQLQCPKCGGPVIDSAAPRLPAGRGRVQPHEILALRAQTGATARAQLPTVRQLPRKAAAKKAAAKLPDPQALIKIAQELAADVEKDSADDPPVKSTTVKKTTAFERITGKKAAPTTAPADKKTDPDAAAAALAALLKKA